MITNSKAADATPFRYCGRTFTEAEIETIRQITEHPWRTTRAEIARAVCEALHWLQPDGRPKLASCQVALRRMEAIIHISWPSASSDAFRVSEAAAMVSALMPLALGSSVQPAAYQLYVL